MTETTCNNTEQYVTETMNYLCDNILRVPKQTQEAANSLLLQWSQRPGRFSEKQFKFAASIVRQLRGPVLKEELGSFERVIELFEAAKRKFKYPKLRLQLPNKQKVMLSVAGANSRFPGTVNVSDGGPYGESVFFGRVTKDGQYEIITDKPGVKELLKRVSDNPLEVAQEYGRMTGICCCCGRELTNGESIELGIGPICAENWRM